MSPLANKLFSLFVVFLFEELTSSVLTILNAVLIMSFHVYVIFSHPSIYSNDPITDNLFPPTFSLNYLFSLFDYFSRYQHIFSSICAY